MKIELVLTIIGGFAATFKWIYEYSSKLKWEKNKFLLDKIEDFQNLESTKTMNKILDWNSISIFYKNNSLKVDDMLLYESFKTHDDKHKFTSSEVLLRGLFDEYFDNLNKFVILCRCDLISEKNFILFMEYWFNILSGESMSKNRELVEQIHKYLEFYNYGSLLYFIKKHNKENE
jgi:hypothetical protein